MIVLDFSIVRYLFKSKLYKMNRSEPSVEPWGTPIFTSREEESFWLLSTNYDLLLKKSETSPEFFL